jgi:hypothetical protein
MRKVVSSLVTLQAIHNPAGLAVLQRAPSTYSSLPTSHPKKNFTSAVDSALSKVYIRPAHNQARCASFMKLHTDRGIKMHQHATATSNSDCRLSESVSKGLFWNLFLS